MEPSTVCVCVACVCVRVCVLAAAVYCMCVCAFVAALKAHSAEHEKFLSLCKVTYINEIWAYGTV